MTICEIHTVRTCIQGEWSNTVMLYTVQINNPHNFCRKTKQKREKKQRRRNKKRSHVREKISYEIECWNWLSFTQTNINFRNFNYSRFRLVKKRFYVKSVEPITRSCFIIHIYTKKGRYIVVYASANAEGNILYMKRA